MKIHMDAFIRKYQPDRYELWLEGQDIGPHPENPNLITAAAPHYDLEKPHHTKVYVLFVSSFCFFVLTFICFVCLEAKASDKQQQ